MRLFSNVVLGILVAAGPLGAQTPSPPVEVESKRPVLRASAAAAGVRLDGRLDDAAWAGADSIAELTQVEPVEGGAPSARTVVKVLADPGELVIGVVAYDPDPSGIVSYSKAPDSDLGSEDHVRIVLDPFLDGRSGYVFAVGPSGARYDALVASQGTDENQRWDAVWEARTARGGWGWSAEIRIPIRSLAFRSGVDAWGFNVQRRIQRLQETDRWAGAARDFEVTQTSRAGLLDGLPGFTLGMGLSIRPALTSGGGYPSPDSAFSTSVHPSLDVTQRLGPNLLASLTLNTDFAETEVDTRQTNLTRFPLFFPEKRTFFLEGSDIFDFGLGLDEDVVPFFSRRIGLVGDESVPVAVGGKLNGRIGGTSVGAVVATTRAADTLAAGGAMGVLRVRQNVLRESSLGFIGAFGDPLGRSGSWMFGPDVTFQTSRFRGDKNFFVGVWALATGRAELSGDRTAAGLKVDYPNDLWDVSLKYKRIGEAFDPSLGFVPRPGVHLASLGVDWQPRPKRPIGPLRIRQCFWENQLSYVAGVSGGWQSYRYFMAPINCRLESGDRFEFNIAPQGERLAEPFDVVEGLTIPAGEYDFLRFRLEAGLAAKRKVSGQLTWWFGGFYGGTLHQMELTSAWKPSPSLTLELNAEHDIGRLPGRAFTTDVVGTRVHANFSPDLQVSSFIQYDTESDAVGTNTRLRWTFTPLGALFVVYNHNLAEPAGAAALERWNLGRLRFASNRLLVKAQYALRY